MNYEKKCHVLNRCWSYVGKQGGDQKLSIGVSWQPYCKYKGVLLHELGHSIGFWHEQTRPDRDSYVRIVWENMITSAYLNFLRYSSNEVDSLSIPYDYASIMHYPSNVSLQASILTDIWPSIYRELNNMHAITKLCWVPTGSLVPRPIPILSIFHTETLKTSWKWIWGQG